MSFVYDTRLLRELLKIGQANEEWISPDEWSRRMGIKERVRNTLEALEKQSVPPTPEQQATDIGFQADPSNPNAPAPKLTSTDEETLGALVGWAVKNRMTVGGQRIAYNSNEQPPSEDYVFYKLEPGSKLEPVTTREVTRLGYFINKALLVSFIQSRLIALQKKPNKVEEFQLGMRIDDANKLLGANINKDYKEPEKDDTLLDNLPNPLDVKSWGASGNNPLYIKDVKSVDALRGWLQRVNMVLKDRRGREFRSDDVQNFDICSIITVLNQRAQAKGRGSQEAAAKSYIDHMAQLAQQANCSGQGGQPGGAGGGAGGQGGNPQLLQQLMTLRPFNTQYVSFPEIKKWLDTYSGYANDPDITDTAQKLGDFMDSFKTKTNSSADTIQLNNLDTNRFKSMMQNPADAINMANYLYDIVSQAGALYQRMVTQLQNIGQDPRFSSGYRAMQQQITAGGPQQTNLTDLDDLRQNLSRQWQQHK